MTHGRKREIRRMCAALGYPVTSLVRTAIGPFRDQDLAPGTVRPLTLVEVRDLYAAAGRPEGDPPQDAPAGSSLSSRRDRPRRLLPARADCGDGGVPGDESLSHRALILGSMAEGRTGQPGSAPGRTWWPRPRRCGRWASPSTPAGSTARGSTAWTAPGRPLDCANSGTTIRLLAGALSGRPFATTLSGDTALRRRPMRRLVAPLAALGADIGVTEPQGTAPVTVRPVDGLRGASVLIDLPSAQLRSAVELAALQAVGSTVVRSPEGYRDHTERWLVALGRGAFAGPGTFRVDPGPVPVAEYRIPGDPSSAAFLWAAAALRPGAKVTTPNVSLNPGRIGFLQILESFGAGVGAEVTGSVLGEPVGLVTVTGRTCSPSTCPRCWPPSPRQLIWSSARCRRRGRHRGPGCRRVAHQGERRHQRHRRSRPWPRRRSRAHR